MGISLPSDLVHSQHHRCTWQQCLNVFDSSPLSRSRLRGVSARYDEILPGDDDVTVLWELTQIGLQLRDTVVDVARAISKSRERMVGHRFDGFVHRKDAVGLTNALIGRPVRRNPVGNHALLLLV